MARCWESEGEEETVGEDEYAKLVRRMNPPRVVIDNDSSDNATVIRVDRVKKHGILLEAVQVLVELDLVITKAYISSDGNWFMDVFNVTDREGRKLMDRETIDCIQRCLESEDGHLVRPPGSGEAEGEEPTTSVELTGADRPGLLSEVCAVLASLGCNIVKGELWTQRGRAAAVLRIIDEATGLAIRGAGQLSKVREHLGDVMRGNGGGGGRCTSGVGDGPCGTAVRGRRARREAPAQADARRRRRRAGSRHGEDRQRRGRGDGLRGAAVHGGHPAVQGPAETAVRHAVRARRPSVRRLPRHRPRRRRQRRGLPRVLRPARRRPPGAHRRRAAPPPPVPRGRRREACFRRAGAGGDNGGQSGAPLGDHSRVPGERPVDHPGGDQHQGRRRRRHLLRVRRLRQPCGRLRGGLPA